MIPWFSVLFRVVLCSACAFFVVRAFQFALVSVGEFVIVFLVPWVVSSTYLQGAWRQCPPNENFCMALPQQIY